VSEKVRKTDAEWKRQLSRPAYEVTRQKGMEMAFTGEYNKHSLSGVYHCVCCGAELFRSEAKFDSSSGWPAFTAPAAEANIATETDESFGMVRVEVMCSRCDAHLGHLFDDGPPPTGRHYRINSVALDFRSAGD